LARISPTLPVTTHNFTNQEHIMKTLRYTFTVSVLVLTFTLSTLAGDMHTGAPQPEPTPVPAQGDMHTTVAGDISTMNADAEAAGGSVTAAAVALIQSVLSLF
jgi:hypothetical protein